MDEEYPKGFVLRNKERNTTLTIIKRAPRIEIMKLTTDKVFYVYEHGQVVQFSNKDRRICTSFKTLVKACLTPNARICIESVYSSILRRNLDYLIYTLTRNNGFVFTIYNDRYSKDWFQHFTWKESPFDMTVRIHRPSPSRFENVPNDILKSIVEFVCPNEDINRREIARVNKQFARIARPVYVVDTAIDEEACQTIQQLKKQMETDISIYEKYGFIVKNRVWVRPKEPTRRFHWCSCVWSHSWFFLHFLLLVVFYLFYLLCFPFKCLKNICSDFMYVCCSMSQMFEYPHFILGDRCDYCFFTTRCSREMSFVHCICNDSCNCFYDCNC
jgi:hypothetical protein